MLVEVGCAGSGERNMLVERKNSRSIEGVRNQRLVGRMLIVGSDHPPAPLDHDHHTRGSRMRNDRGGGGDVDVCVSFSFSPRAVYR